MCSKCRPTSHRVSQGGRPRSGQLNKLGHSSDFAPKCSNAQHVQNVRPVGTPKGVRPNSDQVEEFEHAADLVPKCSECSGCSNSPIVFKM